jgi:tetratricopeptide (TPR) repeat protein
VKLAKPLGEIGLPTTVQGVLASRIDRLGREEKDLLQTLAVIGREFPFALVRQVVGEDSTLAPETAGEGNLERILAHLQLAEFIYEQPSVSDLEYTFKHALTQEVAYRSVLGDRRAQLHRRIAAAIESHYGERLEEHFAELANHYSRAGDNPKAVHYFHLAAERASARSAYAEALAHLTIGLELLKNMPEGVVRDQKELRMQWDLGSASVIVNGVTANETEAALSRAYELCCRGSESPDLVLTLAGLTWLRLFTGAVHKAHEAGQELLKVAERVRDPASVAIANVTLSFVLVFLAELEQARERLEQALALYESLPELTGLQSRQWVFALVYLGRTLWLLGFPDQALKRTREAEGAGQRSTDPQAKAMGLNLSLNVHLWCGNLDVVREHLQPLSDAPWAKGVNPELLAWRDLLSGWLIAREGQSQGIALIRDAIAKQASIHNGLFRSDRGSLLAEACASLGRIGEAMAVLEETLPCAESEEHYYEAELHRLRGELLLMRTDVDREAAEQCFGKAIDIARRQSAKSWELRATTSLARLLRDTNRRDEARAMLAEIYNWFTEGFDTADLKDAKTLLDELRH